MGCLTLRRSDRRVSMSVAMDGMLFTHWQYSRKIRISNRTVLKKQRRDSQNTSQNIFIMHYIHSNFNNKLSNMTKLATVLKKPFAFVGNLPNNSIFLPVDKQKLCRFSVIWTCGKKVHVRAKLLMMWFIHNECSFLHIIWNITACTILAIVLAL